MFETPILRTKFAGNLADCMFRRISGCEYEGDISFISTLRALLMHVDLGDHRVSFRVSDASIDNFDQEETCHHLIRSNLCADSITYLSVSVPFDVDQNTAKERFFLHAAPEDVHEFMDVREFFAQKMACRAVICEQTRSALIIVLSSNLKKHHLAQCILPKMLPWYFGRTQLSNLQRNLLFSLTSRTPESYSQNIEAISDTDWFRQRTVSASMQAFKRRGMERQKNNTKAEIDSCEARIERINQDLLVEIRRLNEQNMRLNGIMMAMESDENDSGELAEFLAANSDVEIMSMDGDNMQILVKGYLDIYDPDAYASLARNQNSWYWSGTAAPVGVFMSYTARKLVMDAIFSDTPTFKIRSFGLYTLNCNSNDVIANGGRYNDNVPRDRYANPHLNYASCLGSYRSHIIKQLGRGDIVGAISQCISSAHSVNVTESATFRHLCRDIFVSDQPILEGPEGKLYTTLQAYEYLTTKE